MNPNRGCRKPPSPGDVGVRAEDVPRDEGHEAHDRPQLRRGRELRAAPGRIGDGRCIAEAALDDGGSPPGGALPARLELRLEAFSALRALPLPRAGGVVLLERSLDDPLRARQLGIVEDPELRPTFGRRQATQRAREEAVPNHTPDPLGIEHVPQVIDHERVLGAVDPGHDGSASLPRRPPTPEAATIRPARTKSAFVTRLQWVQRAPEAMPIPRARRRSPARPERRAHTRPSMTLERIAPAVGRAPPLGKRITGLAIRKAPIVSGTRVAGRSRAPATDSSEVSVDTRGTSADRPRAFALADGGELEPPTGGTR